MKRLVYDLVDCTEHEMWTIDAAEAVKNGAGRFSTELADFEAAKALKAEKAAAEAAKAGDAGKK